MKQLLVVLLASILILGSCKKENSMSDCTTESSHLEYFGFTLIDTYWDDPTDAEEKTNYSDEIYTFCNTADILVVNPSDDIEQRIIDMSDLD